jgi:hypothetical protein
MNKWYENKTDYDPGRFRYKVSFQQEVSISEPSGGTLVNLQNVLTTFAIREIISRRPNFAGDIIEGGNATLLEGDWNFIIRYRPSFYPTKSMVLVCENITYTIRNIQEIDEPTKYIKILAVKAE